MNNTTDRDRLAYLWSYFPADMRVQHHGSFGFLPSTISMLTFSHRVSFCVHQYWGTEGSNGNPGKERLRAEDETQFPVIFRPAPLQVDAEAQAAKL